MNRWIITLFIGLGMLLLFSGCASMQPEVEVKKQEPKVIVQKVDKEDNKKDSSRREVFIPK